MAPDLGLVMHAAERQPHEFAAHGPGDRLAERGLAHAGRADEAQDRALAIGLQLAHREIFEDALLDLGQAVMVLVEDAAGFGDVDLLVGQLRPGQLDQPIEIGADHAVLGGCLGHALEPLELLQRLVLGFLGHAGFGDRLAQFGNLGLAVLALAKLLLDLAKLLAQDVLALASGQRFLRLLADLLGQPQHLDLLGEVAQQLVEPFAGVERLQQVLLLGRREVRDIGDEVGQRRRRLNLLDGRGDLGRQVGQQRNRLAGALLQLVHARGDLGGKHLGLADLVDARHQERIARQEFEHAEAPYAAGHQMMIAVRRGDIAQDFAHGADAMEMLGARRLDRGVALQQHADRLVRLRCRLGAGDRLLAAERERHHDAGEQHRIAGRQDDQRAGGKLGVRGGPARRTRRSGRLLVASGLRGFGRLRRDMFGIGHIYCTKLQAHSLAKVSTRQPLHRSRSARRKRGERVMRRSKRP